MKRYFISYMTWVLALPGYFLLQPAEIKANDTLHYYINNLVFVYEPICEGDTFVNNQIFFPCPCPTFFEFYNTHQYPNTACNYINCEMVGMSFPVVQGPNIIENELSGYSTGSSCDGLTLPIWHLKAAPEVTSDYIVFWDKYEFEEYASCGAGNTVRAYHYRDTFTVTVHNVPVPDFTIDIPEVLCGATISMTFQNCAWGQSPSYYKEVMDACGQGQTSTCQNPVYTVSAPDYLTEIGFTARYQRSDYPYCRSDWSPYQYVSIVESPDQNACNDPSIQVIEDLLSDPNNLLRDDYHEYSNEEVICTYPWNGPRPCTVSSIWGFMKSRADNQAPTYGDYPPILNIIPSNTLLLLRAGFGMFFPPNTDPLTNCQALDLPPTLERIGLAILLAFLQKTGQSGLCNNQTLVNIQTEPIKVVIDEGCKCITNYTLPGHVLYPGKVRRCLFQEGCDTFKVKTTGVGFHFCGDNWVGEAMGWANILVGGWTFNMVNQRFVYNFNH